MLFSSDAAPTEPADHSLLSLLFSSKHSFHLETQTPPPKPSSSNPSSPTSSHPNPLPFTRDFAARDSPQTPHGRPRPLLLRPRLALHFLRWAELQPGFHFSEIAFVALLAEGGLMDGAFSVSCRAFRLRLLHGLFDLLIIGDAVTARLRDLLLSMYTKCSMVDRPLSTFYKMAVHVYPPTSRTAIEF